MSGWNRHWRVIERQSSRMIERITRNPFRGAWRATAIVTIGVTVISGLLMRITDRDTFPSLWKGMWWAAQTVTTVGYGDAVPSSVPGRVLAVLVMMFGVAFLTVTSAAIASAFVEAARRGRVGEEGQANTAVRSLELQVAHLTAEVRRLREDLAGRPAAPREGPPPA